MSSVDHPSHYNTGKIEVIDFIEDQNLNFSRGNALKYLVRAGVKDKSKEVEYLQKAVWYINREIERISKPLNGQLGEREDEHRITRNRLAKQGVDNTRTN